MKLQLFIVLVIVAGAYALPRAKPDVVIVAAESRNKLIQRSIVEDQIRNIIEQVISSIQSSGLDPFVVEREEIEIRSVVLNVAAKAFIENLRFSGASDIRIHSLNYNHIFNRLRFDISLPDISLTIGDSGVEIVLFDNEFKGQFKGSLSIKSVRLVGEVHVNVGIEGISLRSLLLDFSLGGIESDLTLVVLGNDISEDVNNLLGKRIPFFLESNRTVINRLLEFAVRDFLNDIWSV